MKFTHHASAPTLLALAAALSLGACKDREERIPTAKDSAAPSTSTADTSARTGSTTSGAGTSAAAGTNAATATAALPPADADFVTKAAEGGQFEVQVAKLAVDKATDPAVKAFAQMLVEDHQAANDKLRQIASSHGVALPAALPEAKKKELEQLGKLSGPEFDRRFVKMIGIGDHRHDIGEFEKAGQTAKSEDVKGFVQSSLPTLKKHLAAAEKLPGAGKG
jgi:putative membrane protein